MQRENELKRLRHETFDVLVIGGGATGAGIAVDAASRGLKTALVEAGDFSSETSSRSTKLIHGGVRYLEQAILRLDRSQFRLVRDALHERMVLLRNAPHLAHALPILTPLYGRLEAPYYRTGLRLYDNLSGKACIRKSYFVARSGAIDLFPLVKQEGLRGGVVYYDGQFDDARMNLALILTARDLGAATANYVRVVSLLKDRGRICGAEIADILGKAQWSVCAKVVINATGPFADAIRKLDTSGVAPILRASSGVHLVLDQFFTDQGNGLLIPKTRDGRVLFVLPWLGRTLVGTTDHPVEVRANPRPTAGEIDEILGELNRYLSVPVGRAEVRAAWSGLRPLIAPTAKAQTARISRDHHLETSPSGLITIAGGKWTTYRRMAEDAVDEAVRWGGLLAGSRSRTAALKLHGAEKYRIDGAAHLQRELDLPLDIAEHLNQSYGDKAESVVQLMRQGYDQRLAEGYPYTEAEVVYAVRAELACSSVDVLARRLRLGFLDRRATLAALTRVSEIVADGLGWSREARSQDEAHARVYFDGEI